MLLRYPLIIHAELMTHRKFSRCAESSRARPFVAKTGAHTPGTYDMVMSDPYVPIEWRRDIPGMTAGDEMSAEDAARCEQIWRDACAHAMGAAAALHAMGLHKQWTNRLFAFAGHISVLVSATDWANWYALRQDTAAMPEMQRLANVMRAAHEASIPVQRVECSDLASWHLPFVTDEERAERDVDWRWASAGRCARLSYLNHDGVRDPRKDEDLGRRCAENRHASPLEHVACAVHETALQGMLAVTGLNGRRNFFSNFVRWVQLRKFTENEHPFTTGQVFP